MKPWIRALIAHVIIFTLAGAVVAAAWPSSVEFAGWPLFAVCALLGFVVQWVVFIPSYLAQTEHYFDLTGSLTYITLVIIALVYGNADPRSLLLGVLVLIWAGRLGSFLFLRIRRAGRDPRFDAIKVLFPRFLTTWSLQGLWVFLTLACALAAMTGEQSRPLGLVGLIGLLVWLCGFAIEAVADRQKSAFRNDPANTGRFIQSGLWAWSRHPNYFGEIVLWAGVAIIAFPVLQGWQYVTLISPVFVALLLTRISGVPLLEQRADKEWGDNPEYQRYKAATPSLIPRPPKSK
ncbi:DUF1295 domain-containing protein [Litorivivens sp.]|uniref:DUF1295 domain-containing protein n=1 Tax=Litorivivens sp. TaxID=2020868 RepID=UPI00356296B8